MKKTLSLVLAGILAIGVLVGFSNGNSSNNKKSNQSNTEVMDVNQQTAPPEYVNPNKIKDQDIFMSSKVVADLRAEAIAKNFEAMYNNADLVIECTVKEVQPFVEESANLNSIVTPDDVKVYKGEYKGQRFKGSGGVMKFDEYMAYPQVKKQFEGREDPNAKDQDTSNKYFVSENEEFNPLYTKGDRILIFLKKFDKYNYGFEGASDIMSLSNAYQSSFIINGDVIENKMFERQQNDTVLNSLNQEIPNKMRGAKNWQFNKNEFISKLESFSK